MWSQRPAAGSQSGRFRRGVGVAAANWLYILDPGSELELSVEGGVVVARTGTQDIGTGIRSVLTHILCADLGLPADRVRVEIGMTDTVHGPIAGGSRTTPSMAPTARDAARHCVRLSALRLRRARWPLSSMVLTARGWSGNASAIAAGMPPRISVR